ncbi:MAG: gamma-glutamyl-gamma-aminobutyrate hydrolase [Gammaproteobacteria bacterium]|jgi:putative glutamine amidotransferase|nr:gamma-glutamyl-gamma-aminobutyrate hydrolase [Gammaproteobacteria bacterium]|tara:strand:+ start:985 stop:1740 length:756 start_codon:yes stop_codon:yes gene_type:complete
MKPVVIIPSDVKKVAMHPTHCVGEKYIHAVSHGADILPLMLPAIGAGEDLESLEQQVDINQVLDLADGILLTGSVSNVDPVRYGKARVSGMSLDEQRDATIFPLLQKALERELPVLAICRGIQELNVAFGGTLHSAVHTLGDFDDHRETDGVPREQMYEPAHEIEICAGGLLEEILGLGSFMVNSLHGQGIADLGQGLRVEAISPDGLIEAVSFDGHFVLGVQWHPEWAFANNVQSRAIFDAFGKAVRREA